jgi:DUF4097 and DUF4098 domain-containing protein YvlB
MKINSLKRTLWLTGIAVFFVLTFAVGCTCSSDLFANTEDVINRSFDVSEGGTLTMNVDRASIKVETNRGKQVEVEVIRKVGTSNEERAEEILAKYQIDFHHSGSDVTIETGDHTRSRGFFSWLKNKNLRIHFMVTVPEKYNLNLKTSGGSITVSDIQGDVKARTSGGSLKFAYIKGPVWGKTSGGSIQLERCTGNADVKTSGGSLRIGTVEGEVKANTSGGSIKVKEVMGTINAHTSGGSISVFISKQPAGDCNLTTSGGSITVRLSENINLDVDAKTSGGHVSTEFPVIMQGTLSKQRLEGKINDGGPLLFLKTSGGSIRIKKM